MKVYSSRITLLLLLFLTVVIGCRKTVPDLSPKGVAELPSTTAASIHWLGKRQLGIEGGAYYLMRIWGLPESKQLEAQTLNKLSLAPWRFSAGMMQTNVLSPYLQDLLQDLVQEECYLEIGAPTNELGEAVLALRLSNHRAGIWQTNLAVVLQAIYGIPLLHRDHDGWSMKRPTAPNVIELTRVREWTLIGVGQEKNRLLGDLAGRVQQYHVPFPRSSNSCWLDMSLDVGRAARAFGVSLSHDWPHIRLLVDGDGASVQLKGVLGFNQPLQLQIEPWNIPTNLIHQPIARFTALRGLGAWLSSWQIWEPLHIRAVPNEVFFWEPEEIPLQVYWAAPTVDAATDLRSVTNLLLRFGNPWIARHGVGAFSPSGSLGVSWTGLPLISPFVSAIHVSDKDVVFGGLIATNESNSNPPPGLPWETLSRTNVVFYDWEATGARLESWAYLAQIFRFAFGRAQIPAESASMVWLRALSPRLAASRTVVTFDDSNTLKLVRKATLGFTAFELQVLIDWLESPQFPSGMYTSLSAPPPPQVAPDSPNGKPRK